MPVTAQASNGPEPDPSSAPAPPAQPDAQGETPTAAVSPAREPPARPLRAPAESEPAPTPPTSDRSARPVQPATAVEPPVATNVDQEAAIRGVIASYARAIETKDLSLFRALKPNLTADEERRIEEGFRAVSSQRVQITILSIERDGSRATVRLQRRDTIDAGGRRQTTESFQTITLTREADAWVIDELGT